MYSTMRGRHRKAESPPKIPLFLEHMSKHPHPPRRCRSGRRQATCRGVARQGNCIGGRMVGHMVLEMRTREQSPPAAGHPRVQLGTFPTPATDSKDSRLGSTALFYSDRTPYSPWWTLAAVLLHSSIRKTAAPPKRQSPDRETVNVKTPVYSSSYQTLFGNHSHQKNMQKGHGEHPLWLRLFSQPPTEPCIRVTVLN